MQGMALTSPREGSYCVSGADNVHLRRWPISNQMNVTLAGFAGRAEESAIGRNEQYERLYLASAPRNHRMVPTFAHRTRANELVGRFLNEPLS